MDSPSANLSQHDYIGNVTTTLGSLVGAGAGKPLTVRVLVAVLVVVVVVGGRGRGGRGGRGGGGGGGGDGGAVVSVVILRSNVKKNNLFLCHHLCS